MGVPTFFIFFGMTLKSTIQLSSFLQKTNVLLHGFSSLPHAFHQALGGPVLTARCQREARRDYAGSINVVTLRSSHVVTIFPFIDDVPKKTFVFMELPHVFWRGKSSRNDDKWIYMREIPQIWLRDVHPPKATRDYLGMSSKYMGGWHGEDDQVHLGWPQRHLSHSLSFAANVHTFFWETIQQSSLFLQ